MSLTQVQPYLLFGGRCEEALAFYQRAAGAKIDMMLRFDQSPDPVPAGMLAPGFERKVMHAAFTLGPHQVLACDGANENEKSTAVSLALTVTEEAEVDRLFGALTDGGQVMMAPGRTFWSKRFAMGRDRFGIGWMVMVPDAPTAS
jgi:PhnB protein